MKRTYEKPKAVLMDFRYDEKVTASSTDDGKYDMYGLSSVMRCQYGSGSCTSIFNPANASVCDVLLPWSRR